MLAIDLRHRACRALQSVFADVPPRMSEAETAIYTVLLGKARTVVEYGAGGSTLLALKSKAAKIISIESDPKWVRRLRRHWRVRMGELLGRLTLRCVNIGPVKKWSRPKDEATRHLWPKYTKAPWQKTIPSADLVLVDGRFRVASIAQAAIHAPNATIVVHDFWNRPYYHDALTILDEVARADTIGVFTVKQASQHDALRLYDRFCFDWR